MLHRVLSVDPEDLQCHYNLMLCLRALGQNEEADREETLFRRFKADESSTMIAARQIRLSPELNNSRQPIHDHVSVPLGNLTNSKLYTSAPSHRDAAKQLSLRSGL